jgi:hypothetical protein
MKFSALNAEINIVSSSYNLQIILFHFFFFDVEGVLGPEFHLLFVD